jgi:myo-inositol-1(or 4)-monophosphatase
MPTDEASEGMNARVDLLRALEVARRVARQAGDLLRDRHGEPFAVEHKGDVDLVTELDRRSEALVVSELSRAFPDHTIVGEEGSEVRAGGDIVWFVDPLDGTTNFAHGLPIYAVSLGLEIDERPALGVVYAPELGWEYWGARGLGAYLGEQRLHVSTHERLEDGLVATGFPYDRRTALDNNVPELAAIIRRCQGVRRIGVASIDCALVAQGALDGYWEYKLQPWDIAAGALLVLEADGRVTDIDGGAYHATRGQILASNGRIHDELSSVLLQVRRERAAQKKPGS